MKSFKLILIGTLLLFSSTGVLAQLLERNNVTSRIAVGTRPQKGDLGFLVGASIEEVKEMFDDDLSIRGFPLMSFKYYLSDRLELRLNTQSYAKSKVIQGSIVNQVGKEDDVDKESFMRFMVSGQYHFSSSNLFDAYAGLGFIIGSEKNEILTTEKTNITGDYVANHMTKKTMAMGFNINYGVQAFVSDLPISLGLEASIRGINHAKLQYENTFASSVGGVVTNQTYFTVDKDNLLKYQSLDYKSFDLGADVRVLLTYYFRR